MGFRRGATSRPPPRRPLIRPLRCLLAPAEAAVPIKAALGGEGGCKKGRPAPIAPGPRGSPASAAARAFPPLVHARPSRLPSPNPPRLSGDSSSSSRSLAALPALQPRRLLRAWALGVAAAGRAPARSPRKEASAASRSPLVAPEERRQEVGGKKARPSCSPAPSDCSRGATPERPQELQHLDSSQVRGREPRASPSRRWRKEGQAPGAASPRPDPPPPTKCEGLAWQSERSPPVPPAAAAVRARAQA